MKAREENSVITKYNQVPKVWKQRVNFRSGGVPLWESEGFFDYIIPTYDENIEKLGAIFFNGTIFTHPIEALSQQEIDDKARANNRRTKAEAIDEGAQVVNNGDTFFFSKENWVDFSLITDANTGNIKWFDVDDNEINLTVARQNQIKGAAADVFLAIINS